MRIRRRWASSSLPARSSSPSRWRSSASMLDHGLAHALVAGAVVGVGEDHQFVELVADLAGHHVEGPDALDGVAEELDADGLALVGGVDLHGVAPGPELPAGQGHVVPRVLELHQPPEQGPLVVLLAGVQGDDPVAVLVGRAQPVDARDRGHHDGVGPEQQGRGAGVAQPVDLVVDGRVLLDIGVRRGDVRLGLVVVVVGDEVLHPVVGEELLELGGQLGGQRLVGLDDQGGPLDRLDGPGDGGRLAGSGDAQQRLVAVAALEPGHQAGDGLGLVAGGAEGRNDLEVGHASMVPGGCITASGAGRSASQARSARLGPRSSRRRWRRSGASPRSAGRTARPRPGRPRPAGGHGRRSCR